MIVNNYKCIIKVKDKLYIGFNFGYSIILIDTGDKGDNITKDSFLIYTKEYFTHEYGQYEVYTMGKFEKEILIDCYFVDKEINKKYEYAKNTGQKEFFVYYILSKFSLYESVFYEHWQYMKKTLNKHYDMHAYTVGLNERKLAINELKEKLEKKLQALETFKNNNKKLFLSD